MSEIKVIREDKYGVLVTINDKILICRSCKYYELEPTNSPCYGGEDGVLCVGGRYLTEQEEQEYYSSKRAEIMTPKEKAKEIVSKMYFTHRNINSDAAKNCALIAVDEVIDQWDYIDTYIADLGGLLNPNLQYWYQVKKDIEQLKK